MSKLTLTKINKCFRPAERYQNFRYCSGKVVSKLWTNVPPVNVNRMLVQSYLVFNNVLKMLAKKHYIGHGAFPPLMF